MRKHGNGGVVVKRYGCRTARGRIELSPGARLFHFSRPVRWMFGDERSLQRRTSGLCLSAHQQARWSSLVEYCSLTHWAAKLRWCTNCRGEAAALRSKVFRRSGVGLRAATVWSLPPRRCHSKIYRQQRPTLCSCRCPQHLLPPDDTRSSAPAVAPAGELTKNLRRK
jgi:hypothetical protein